MFIEALVEGTSDVPVVREVFQRRFGLIENVDFRIHPHRGRGRLPPNPLADPNPKHRGLLDQLPAKLRGYGSYLDGNTLVMVVIDADDDDCRELLQQLRFCLNQLDRRPPRVLFRLAIEETESWFLADAAAIKAANPKAKTKALENIAPDANVGAWEKLAEALNIPIAQVTGREKLTWAEHISPFLDLDAPKSPSLARLITGIERETASAENRERNHLSRGSPPPR
jgi:hypothetical protein